MIELTVIEPVLSKLSSSDNASNSHPKPRSSQSKPPKNGDTALLNSERKKTHQLISESSSSTPTTAPARKMFRRAKPRDHSLQSASNERYKLSHTETKSTIIPHDRPSHHHPTDRGGTNSPREPTGSRSRTTARS